MYAESHLTITYNNFVGVDRLLLEDTRLKHETPTSKKYLQVELKTIHKLTWRNSIYLMRSKD